MTKKYTSKVSYELLAIAFVVLFSPLILNLFNDGINMNLILIGLFLTIIFGLITHMLFTTKYTIEENKININCGFFTYKPIANSAVREITKSNNIISSPAASFDRIEIKYGKLEMVLISPKNKFEFAQYITSLNSKIKIT